MWFQDKQRLELCVRDTQAGLKIFRRKVVESVLPRLIVKRYCFDLEMLVVSRHLGFKRIYEAPIKLSYRMDDLSHAFKLKDFFKSSGLWGSFLDTLAIIYRLRFLKYYDYNNKRKWVYDKELDMRINVG